MIVSEQDNYYLQVEGDSFFERNFKNKDLPELRIGKQVILENIQKSKIEFNNVLEYGCCYADLLALFKTKYNKNVIGVEASAQAIEFCKTKYNNSFPVARAVPLPSKLSCKSRSRANRFAQAASCAARIASS